MAKLDLFAALKMIELHKAKLHKAMAGENYSECASALRALSAESAHAANIAEDLNNVKFANYRSGRNL